MFYGRKLLFFLDADWLTDINEINPLGIEIWYRMTRFFFYI